MANKLPLVPVASCYAAGILLGDWLQFPLLLCLCLSFGFLMSALALPKHRTWLLPLLLVATGCAAIRQETEVLSASDLRLHLGTLTVLAEVRGELVETPVQRVTIREGEEQPRWTARLRVTALSTNGTWYPASGEIVTSTRGTLPGLFHRGQRLQAGGVMAPPPGPRAPGLLDYRGYLRRHSVHYQLRADSERDWQLTGPPSAKPVADRVVAWAYATCGKGLSEDLNLQLLRAMVLGQRGEVDTEAYEPFIRSGTMHIFAISGLHIALISGIVIVLLRVARIGRGWCGVIVIPLIWFYTGATGWQSSAIRSTIMMTVVVAGWALRRPGSVVNSLAASAVFILLWNPQQLFQASFQLSFFVVLCIALIVPKLDQLVQQRLVHDPFLPAPLLSPVEAGWWRSLRWGGIYCSTSVAAWLGALPLTAAYFNLLSVVTLVANLLVVPCSNAALACVVGSFCCGAWFPYFSELFNNASWFFMDCMVRLSTWASEFSTAIWYVRSPSPWDVAVYYGVLLGILAGRSFASRYKRLIMLGAGVLSVLYGWRILETSGANELTILPMSGGTAVYEHEGWFSDRLIDTGRSNTVDFITLDFLRAQGVNRLDALFLTHGDLQHVGGATWISEVFQLKNAFAPNTSFRSRAYREVTAELQTKSRLELLHSGDKRAGWEIVHPGPDQKFSRADDGSLCLRKKLRGTSVLYLPDLGRSGQEVLINGTNNLIAEILVAGLPSQGEALSNGLVERIQPRLIIVTDDEFPASERAKPELRERLAQLKIPVIYTSDEGAVVLRTGWGHPSLQTMAGSNFKKLGDHFVRRREKTLF